MTINRIGAGATPATAQDTPAVRRSGPAALPQDADLPTRASAAAAAPSRNLSPQTRQQAPQQNHCRGALQDRQDRQPGVQNRRRGSGTVTVSSRATWRPHWGPSASG